MFFPTYVCVLGVCGAVGHKKRVLHSMRLDIQMVVNHHVDAGNQTPKCSSFTTVLLLQPLFAYLIWVIFLL